MENGNLDFLVLVYFSSKPKWTSLCRGLKYLLKVRYMYIILVYPNVTGFPSSLFGQFENIALCLKKCHKNERHLYLVTHSFTKNSQNVCLFNTHSLIYQYARCNCKLWKAFWFYGVFWVFSYIIDEYLYLKNCIFTKLTEIVCLINIHILECQDAKCECRLWKVLSFNCVLFGYFHILLHVWDVIASSNFYK